MRKLSRQGLGPQFSEGARKLWLALREAGWSQAQGAREVGMTRGQLSKLLYGERKPGRASAETFRVRFGIETPLWDQAPAEPFAPPAATAEQPPAA